mmetsp:Transcript_10518/g.30326  ORF Transcript_10518/g.30326 Transcript_10518/m.30326 type:complete len:109 (-) Transcript_10518:558-884(-)
MCPFIRSVSRSAGRSVVPAGKQATPKVRTDHATPRHGSHIGQSVSQIALQSVYPHRCTCVGVVCGRGPANEGREGREKEKISRQTDRQMNGWMGGSRSISRSVARAIK